MKLIVRLLKEDTGEQANEITLELRGRYIGPGNIVIAIEGLKGCLSFDPCEWEALTAGGKRALKGELEANPFLGRKEEKP